MPEMHTGTKTNTHTNTNSPTHKHTHTRQTQQTPLKHVNKCLISLHKRSIYTPRRTGSPKHARTNIARLQRGGLLDILCSSRTCKHAHNTATPTNRSNSGARIHSRELWHQHTLVGEKATHWHTHTVMLSHCRHTYTLICCHTVTTHTVRCTEA